FPNKGMSYKLKIKSISMSFNGITYYIHTVGSPAIDPISALHLIFTIGSYTVIFNKTMLAMLGENSEIGIVNDIISDSNIFTIKNQNTGNIFNLRTSTILNFKAFNSGVLSIYGKNFML